MESFEIIKYLKSPQKGYGKCIRCDSKTPWNRERTKMHIRNCKEYTNEEKKAFQTRTKQLSTSREALQSQNSDETSSATNTFLCSLNELKESIAGFVFKSGVSFRVVELDCFKQIFSVINPVLLDAVPSRKELSTQLLDKEYGKIQEQLHAILDNSTNLTLISDGWTNVSGQHLVNFCIKSSGTSTFFYKCINTAGISQTSEEIAFQIIQVIEELGPRKFVGVVTDNANNMRGAWKIIESTYPHIACNGCSAHVVNLLISDILHLETFASIVKDSQKVIKFVRNHDFVRAKYEEIRKELNVTQQLVLPVPTRWYSHYNSLKSLLDSKYVLIKLLDLYKYQIKEINPKDNTKEVIRLIERNSFWDRTSKLVSVIEYPTNIIGKNT